jgi:phospholipase/carboxylesterase
MSRRGVPCTCGSNELKLYTTTVNMSNFSLVHRTHSATVGDAPHPVLVLLHGRGADENDLLPLADQLDPRLFTVTPRAPFEFPWGGYVWYNLDERGVGHPDMETLNGSLDKLREFLTQIGDAYPIDPQRTYLGGFSNGAALSVIAALTDPDKVVGAVVLSGYFAPHVDLPYKLDEAAGHPIFQAHGTLDPMIPVVWARAGRDALAKLPVALTYREYPMGHEISQPELQDLSSWFTDVLDRAALTT